MSDVNLNDKKYFEGFSNELQFIIDEDNASKADNFSFYLEKILATPEISQQLDRDTLLKYKKMIITAKMVALPKLNGNEIYRLMAKHLSYVFNIEGYDIWKKIKGYLLTLNSLEERDKFKEGLRNILSKNDTLIYNANIVLNNKEVSSTINNWLMDFRSLYGEDGFLDSIKLSSYLANSKNIKNLTNQEKQKINILFNLYRRLKISSKTIEGLEEDITIVKPDGEIGFIKQGQYERVRNEAVELYKKVTGVFKNKDKGRNGIKKSPIEELTALILQYPVGSLERKAIEEEIARVEREGGGKKVG